MHAAPLTLAGTPLLLDLAGAVVDPASRTLAVADLHLEKGSAYAAGGRLLPPYDTAATLAALHRLTRHYRPKSVVCLGDSFHDGDGPARLAPRDRTLLTRLVGAHDWIWVAGNHDPALPGSLGGRHVVEWRLGNIVFRHDAGDTGAAGTPAGEVSGHFHPRASVSTRGRRVTARCFVSDGRRLILPAFGAYTGGLNALDPAIAGLMRPAFRVFLLGRERLFRFNRNQLQPDPPRLEEGSRRLEGRAG
ncbi:MAG: ligase-associated DNA damage response endonuclease PdeM [Alphaproteobacteria bacterium]|jgi:DNA ligase-associated metallophosphoesterase